MLHLDSLLFLSQRGALTVSAEGRVVLFPTQRNASGLILGRLNRQIPHTD